MVSVSISEPEVMVGVYVEFNAVALEKLPDGADHVALLAVPPKLPDNVTDPPEQTLWGGPAFTVAGELRKMTAVLVAGTQGPGPSGSLVVSVNVTDPEPMAEVYIVESALESEKLPLGADQVALLADPPILPEIASDPP